MTSCGNCGRRTPDVGPGPLCALCMALAPDPETARIQAWLTGYQAWVTAQQAQATAIRVEATNGH